MRKKLVAALLFGLCGWTLLAGDETFKTNPAGIDTRNFDNTCKPCDDFYQYANGEWLKNNPIPDAYSNWGTMNEIRDRNDDLLLDILQKAAADRENKKGSLSRLVGDFYSLAMDEKRADGLNAAPLEADLKRIAGFKNSNDLKEYLGDAHLQGHSFLFSFQVEQDLKDSTRYIFYAGQGGLGLPDRDYYLKDDEASQKLRDQYKQHVAKMLTLIGSAPDRAEQQAETVFGIEARLAKVSLSRVQRRDPNSFYRMVTLAEADEQTPHFSWTWYTQKLGLQMTSFSLPAPDFFNEMDVLFKDLPLDAWKTYLSWHLVRESAPYLGSDFVAEDFRFNRTVLRGTKQLQPRWKRVLREINSSMGEALGRLYVAEVFPPEHKERAMKMIANLKIAVGERLNKLEWMGEETKKKALHKLGTFMAKVGYPDQWQDFSSLEIKKDSYFANVRRCSAYQVRRNLDRFGKPIDHTEWAMSPQTINAYYNPTKNEIVFPAAILQPPVFDGSMDDAVNYGAMGAVIGHEIMHGFDDKGSQFDAEGNLKNWWSEKDRERFMSRTERLVAQFDGYEVTEGHSVNGELTLGENIGDLAGLTMSFLALQKTRKGQPDPKINGLTYQQRFFISWAQAWRRNDRAEALELQVRTDPHAPAKFRCNGPLTNMKQFREAFGCKKGDPMVNSGEKRVDIW